MRDTKFSQILKVKKQALEKIEIDLTKRRNKLSVLKNEINDLIKQISDHEFPKKGNSIELNSNLAILNTYKNQKQNLSEKINLTNKEIMHFEHLYKKAYLDYEKIKYLEEEEIKKFILKAKKQEQIMLDEIATQRFAYSKENL